MPSTIPSSRPRITDSGVRNSWAISANISRRSRSLRSKEEAISLKLSERLRKSCGPFIGMRDRSHFFLTTLCCHIGLTRQEYPSCQKKSQDHGSDHGPCSKFFAFE